MFDHLMGSPWQRGLSWDRSFRRSTEWPENRRLQTWPYGVDRALVDRPLPRVFTTSALRRAGPKLSNFRSLHCRRETWANQSETKCKRIAISLCVVTGEPYFQNCTEIRTSVVRGLQCGTIKHKRFSRYIKSCIKKFLLTLTLPPTFFLRILKGRPSKTVWLHWEEN